MTKRSDAVKIRRLVTSAILLDNLQRSGTITNATVDQYNIKKTASFASRITNAVRKVRIDKSRRDRHRGVLGVNNEARLLLTEGEYLTALFPSASSWEGLGEVCEMFGVRKFCPTLLRKAASTEAYSNLEEVDRKKIANYIQRIKCIRHRTVARMRRANCWANMTRIWFHSVIVHTAPSLSKQPVPCTKRGLHALCKV